MGSGFVNEIVVGGRKIMGGGGKTKENGGVTKQTCLVSFWNKPGGWVYGV